MSFAWNLGRDYRRAIDLEQQNLENLARIVEGQVSGSLRSVDLLLQDVARELQRDPPPDEAAMVAYMMARAKSFPEVRTVFATDAMGTVTVTTRPEIKGMDTRDRPYYRDVLAAPDKSRFILSKPTLAKPTNVYVIFGSRALLAAGGKWAGLVGVSLELNYFHELLRSIQPSGDGTAILLNLDGDLISRVPDTEKYVGKNYASGPTFTAHMTSGLQASFQRTVPATDGKERFTALRTYAQYPLMGGVSRTVEESLGPWRRHAFALGLTFAALSLAVLSLTWLGVRGQSQLARAKDLTERVIETANVMVVGLDNLGCVQIFNEAAERISGYRRDELIGRDWFEVVVPRARFPEVWEAFGHFRTEDAFPRVFENPILTKSGEKRLISWQNSAVRENGRLLATVSFGIDVTDQRGAEERLRESEEKFRSLYQFSPVGIALNRLEDGAFVEANRALFDMTGYTEAELRGLTYWDLTPREYEADEAAQLQSLDDTGRYGPYEKEYIRKDGSRLPVLLSGALIVDRDGRRVIWSIIQDITRSKEAEQNLRRSLDELTRANIELERFAFVAAHDLQEPLRNIVSYAQLLERELGPGLAAASREHMAIVVSAAHRMRALVGDLLVYSRTMARAESFQVFPMVDAVNAALGNLRESVEEAAAEIVVGGLPEVEGDRFQISMLLQNLIGNALKYRRSEVRCRVEVGAEVRSGEWVFHVRDNGIGIEPAYREKVFEVFRRLHTPEAYPGTGMGLAICRRIADRHGGRVWMESEPGKGSTFFFTLKKKGA
ncbi:MAG: PAS domain S-box protein [Magnetospirillum sp. WYHS-4]